MMVALAIGHFLIYSTLSGYLNHIAREHKGMVNGIYVSVYYLSGAIGSWLPMLMYRYVGWQDPSTEPGLCLTHARFRIDLSPPHG
jgi:predicted MFS family arabinose efflux permease